MSKCISCIENLAEGNLCRNCYEKFGYQAIYKGGDIYVFDTIPNGLGDLIIKDNDAYWLFNMGIYTLKEKINEYIKSLIPILQLPDRDSIARGIAEDLKKRYPKEMFDRLVRILTEAN